MIGSTRQDYLLIKKKLFSCSSFKLLGWQGEAVFSGETETEGAVFTDD